MASAAPVAASLSEPGSDVRYDGYARILKGTPALVMDLPQPRANFDTLPIELQVDQETLAGPTKDHKHRSVSAPSRAGFTAVYPPILSDTTADSIIPGMWVFEMAQEDGAQNRKSKPAVRSLQTQNYGRCTVAGMSADEVDRVIVRGLAISPYHGHLPKTGGSMNNTANQVTVETRGVHEVINNNPELTVERGDLIKLVRPDLRVNDNGQLCAAVMLPEKQIHCGHIPLQVLPIRPGDSIIDLCNFMIMFPWYAVGAQASRSSGPRLPDSHLLESPIDGVAGHNWAEAAAALGANDKLRRMFASVGEKFRGAGSEHNPAKAQQAWASAIRGAMIRASPNSNFELSTSNPLKALILLIALNAVVSDKLVSESAHDHARVANGTEAALARPLIGLWLADVRNQTTATYPEPTMTGRLLAYHSHLMMPNTFRQYYDKLVAKPVAAHSHPSPAAAVAAAPPQPSSAASKQRRSANAAQTASTGFDREPLLLDGKDMKDGKASDLPSAPSSSSASASVAASASSSHKPTTPAHTPDAARLHQIVGNSSYDVMLVELSAGVYKCEMSGVAGIAQSRAGPTQRFAILLT